jgi:perosamine synthetase
MIPYGRQSIDDEDIHYVLEALRGDFLTTGPLVQKFENEIEKVVGASAFSVSSGTAALHCAFAAIRIKKGDEIITPPITFIATQATAALFGAKIVFVDVLPDTANINPELVEAAITARTRAIVAVDYAGHPADMAELRTIADKYGIFLIQDAAHSIGSSYRKKPVGSIADLTTFSFFPTKNLTTAEGGAVSSINEELLDRAKKFARQGLVRTSSDFKITTEGLWHQEVHEFGLNYRLPDVLCALGISQIKRLESFRNNRRRIFSRYTSALSGLEWIQLPVERDYVLSNWHLFPIRVPSQLRRRVFENLRNQGVGVQVNYLPAYRHPVFADYQIDRTAFPQSEKFYAEEISIPMFSDLTEKELDQIIHAVHSSI